ncbi:MAG TPA: FIST N-terminal domain-containing protein [Steroidobacter sp.]|uniref:FIST signal transduction protein n=1 Tax=Steroidobacter sp. TaxID=1978227 RepID=UPI002EDB7937
MARAPHQAAPARAGRASILRLSTAAADDRAAVQEILRQCPGGVPGFAMIFCSTSHDLASIGAALKAAGCTRVVGAATGRAIGAQGFLPQGLTGFHLPARRFQVADTVIEDAAKFGLPDARDFVRALRGRLERNGGAQLPHLFGLLLVDAEARCEEKLIAAIGTQLGGVPIVGGSAGDLYFNPFGHPPGSTRILHHGRALRGAAVLCLVASESPVIAVSHNHFSAGTRRVVITDADPEKRLVREINGRKALTEYAAACGLRRRAKCTQDFAPYPLMIRVGGQFFPRGVQRCYDDGTLEFACAMEPGIVATVARPGDYVARLRDMFEGMRAAIGPPELVIAFECSARTAYMEQHGLTSDVEGLYRDNGVVGFSTLGEQFNTVHVNNSLTCLGIGAAR